MEGPFTPNDPATINYSNVTGGTFYPFDRHCDEQNGLYTHFVRQRNVCYYGDGDWVIRCEQTFTTRTNEEGSSNAPKAVMPLALRNALYKCRF